MNYIAQAQIEADADDLAEDICKHFGKFNVNISIKRHWVVEKRIVFSIKTKGNTREAHVRANAPEVQRKLKLPLFQVVKDHFNLYLIVSQDQIAYNRLPSILSTPAFQEAWKRLQLPYVIGHDVLGKVVMDDLTQFPHLLLGGSTNSGKSVGLQALIISLAYSKSPSQVNFVLIDVGASDLMPFGELPHLSCPVVRDRTAAMRILTAIIAEMERRVELEYADPASFKQLPRLVVVIDEFPSLFMGVDKAVSKTLADDVSALLQRGRHAKIHLVLAAQNPTYQNMRVDLGNITTRIAFKCAKRNFSETILGEGGAESLLGHGDLLLRSPRYDCPQRVQGIYITPTELRQTVQRISVYYRGADANKFVLVLPDNTPAEAIGSLGHHLSCTVTRRWPSDADQLLANVILWALEHDFVSINALVTDYHLGWNKASAVFQRLEELGIIEHPDGKRPRKVIPGSPEDIPEEMIQFLVDAGYSGSSAANAIYSR